MKTYRSIFISDVHRCMGLNRDKVWKGSQRWSWDRAWEIFRDNLVDKK